jgi:hypothetical protein
MAGRSTWQGGHREHALQPTLELDFRENAHTDTRHRLVVDCLLSITPFPDWRVIESEHSNPDRAVLRARMANLQGEHSYRHVGCVRGSRPTPRQSYTPKVSHECLTLSSYTQVIGTQRRLSACCQWPCCLARLNLGVDTVPSESEWSRLEKCAVRPGECCSPRHPRRFEPSPLEF